MSTATTRSPEYLALQKCYKLVIGVVRTDPGSLCDALFSEGYISESVRNYTRTDSIPDENKARKLIDNVIDRIRDDANFFHKFIKILESPHYDNLKKRLNECYQTEKRHEDCSIVELPRSLQANKPCLSHVQVSEGESTAAVNAESTSQTTIDTSFVCPYCKKCSLEQYLSDEGCPEAAGKTLFPYLNTPDLSEEDRMVLEDTLISATTNLRVLFAETDTSIAENLHANVTIVKNYVLDLVNDPEQEENKAEIKKATSIPEIILALQPYKSFLNYEIIERIVAKFGSPEDQTVMQKYVDTFNKFCERSAFELPVSVLSKKVKARKDKDKVLSVKLSKEGFASLRNIISVRQKMASILGVKKWALKICSIENGCVCVRFLVPAAVMSKILPLSPAKKSALREVDINIDDTCSDTDSR